MKLLLSLFIALTPFNFLRISLYRLLLQYDISYKAKIRYLNIVLCKHLIVEDNAGFKGVFNIVKNINKMTIEEGAYIGKLNRLSNINSVYLGAGVHIGSSNSFCGTLPGLSPFKEFENLSIGEKSIITSDHIFDLSDSIEIGKDVTFGGSGTQIWTHGFDLEHIKKQGKIKIGNICYIGSRAMILPGVVIVDKVSIGSGTIVAKSIDQSGFYTSSALIRKGDVPMFKEEDFIEKNNYFFLRK